jgi:hypothetical protein
VKRAANLGTARAHELPLAFTLLPACLWSWFTNEACIPQKRDKSAHLGQIVELPFFGGLSIEETAEVVQISPAPQDANGRPGVTGCTTPLAAVLSWTPERWQQTKEVLATTSDLALADRGAAYDGC